MFLGVEELLKLVKRENLVENLGKRELENPVGATFDLRLDKIYKIKGKTFLGIDERETVNAEEICHYDAKKKTNFTIKPKEFYLTQTIESVNMPLNLLAFVNPRTTLIRSGIILKTGTIDPGYSGKLNFGLFNAGDCEFEIEMGARFCNIFFVEIKGKTTPYQGQWQGGRVVTQGKEKQI